MRLLPTSRVSTALVTAVGLSGSYAVVRLTGIRPLGGALVGAAGVYSGLTWLSRDGAATTAALSAVYIGGFIGSHTLAPKIGAWPSVLAVSAVSAAAAHALSDRKIT